MRTVIAKIFRALFKIPYFKKKYYGFHETIFSPLNLFKDVIQQVKFNNNINLILHVDDWIQENLYFLGEYEKAELMILEKKLKKDSVFIDLGANIGLYTLFASKIIDGNGKIICFEPFSENYKSLETNISINKNSNILCENLAVGEKNDFIKIFYDKREMNLGMASMNLNEYTHCEQIKVVSLDSYFTQNSLIKVDFIKIDIEGHEYSALLGMENILSKFHPTLLIEILEDDKLSKFNNKENVINYLEKLGYKKYYIDDNGNLSEIEINMERMNYLFIKNKL